MFRLQCGVLKPGRGRPFSIYLPMGKAEILVVKHMGEIVSKEINGLVLVAEDEAIVQYFLKSELTKAGYRVIIAEDGEEAFRKFQENREAISLVISDIVMPKMGGRLLYEEISKINPCMKMIFISGYTADMVKCDGMPGELVRFLPKPFSKQALLNEIKSILGGTS